MTIANDEETLRGVYPERSEWAQGDNQPHECYSAAASSNSVILSAAQELGSVSFLLAAQLLRRPYVVGLMF